MTAVDPRAWLVERGLAKPGRGRFSADAKAALDKARADGIVFIDKAAVRTAVLLEKAEQKAAEPPKEVINIYAPHPDAWRTKDYYAFVDDEGNKTMVSVTEACNNCRFSFGWCCCDAPTFTNYDTRKVMTLSAD